MDALAAWLHWLAHASAESATSTRAGQGAAGSPASQRRPTGGPAADGSPARSSGVSEPVATAARTAVAAMITVIDVGAVSVDIIAAVGLP